MLKLLKKEKGFTLIEIMVVLVLLGTLATISIPTYSKYLKQGQVSEAIINVTNLHNIILLHMKDNSEWPSLAELKDDFEINQNYFNIKLTPGDDDLRITITNNNFSINCEFYYDINKKTGKGEWLDDKDANILADYAPSLNIIKTDS